MVRAPSTVFRHGWPRFREWPIWTESKPLIALLLAVTCGYLGWMAFYVVHFHFHPANLALFAALLACVAFSVEMSRRASEPDGVVKDVYAVWELPMVFLLPGLYALVVPAIRLTLSQWRVRKVPVYRRVYTAATIGIGYACARFIFMSMLPAGDRPRDYLWTHTTLWLAAAGAGAIAQWAINQVLIGSAFKLANPHARIRDVLFGRESLHNDATELCAALLVAVGLTISSLTLIIALPLATLLQRSFRHARLLTEAREDSKTGLLNAATWEREAGAEVGRAVRTSSPLAVALLDLDRFKQINDTYGHLIGDEVLRHVADTMTGLLRDYDLAGRFGGEEFVMLLPQTRAPDAFKIADRVRAHIARLPISTAGGEPVPVTVSIGVAALDAGSSRELTELLAAADAALYRAKASGRNQVQMISTSRGLSAVRSPVDDEPAPAAAGGGFRGPGALPPEAGRDPAELGLHGEFGGGEFDEEFAEDEFADAEFAGEEFQVPDEGTASTATTSAFAV
jgi:diguanylate cyclase (GGDEF)-like protein